MKSQFNMTRGVVRVTGDDKMGLDRVFDVSGMRKGVFLVRFYNADAEGTLYLESSNQNTDATDALWLSIGCSQSRCMMSLGEFSPRLRDGIAAVSPTSPIAGARIPSTPLMV